MEDQGRTPIAVHPQLVGEAEAATYLGVSRQFLRKSRMEGKRVGHAEGPPFVKAGRMIRYAISDLDAWITQHRRECNPLPEKGGQCHG